MSETSKEGGYEWELAQAEAGILAAGDDLRALALAQRRHADAIRNMMQGVLVPMFVQLVERSLGEQISPVANGVDGLRTDVQGWASESAARLGKLETRMDASEQDRAQLNERLARIEQLLADRPQQREIERRELLNAINGTRGHDAAE